MKHIKQLSLIGWACVALLVSLVVAILLAPGVELGDPDKKLPSWTLQIIWTPRAVQRECKPPKQEIQVGHRFSCHVALRAVRDPKRYFTAEANSEYCMQYRVVTGRFEACLRKPFTERRRRVACTMDHDGNPVVSLDCLKAAPEWSVSYKQRDIFLRLPDRSSCETYVLGVRDRIGFGLKQPPGLHSTDSFCQK